jgi:hypothetical protein
MRIGSSLGLIAVGAILTFAVTASVSGVNLSTVGVVLMVVGVVGVVISLIVASTTRRAVVVRQPSGSTTWSRGMLTTQASKQSGSRSTAADTAPVKALHETSALGGL